ncbi:MAG: hypothetical protein WA364_18030 [Candidatus Nitrosopolaris sp.]
MTCSTKIRLRKATTITDMYAAFDLGQTIRAVMKRQYGKIVNELKITRQGECTEFLNGTNGSAVIRIQQTVNF